MKCVSLKDKKKNIKRIKHTNQNKKQVWVIGYLIFSYIHMHTASWWFEKWWWMKVYVINNDRNPLMINGINGRMIIFQRLIDWAEIFFSYLSVLAKEDDEICAKYI